MFLEPAVAKPPLVRGVDEDSVNVTYNPSTQPGGFPEKFYIVYKEKGKYTFYSILFDCVFYCSKSVRTHA
jgi:hypothetical protein